MQDVRERVGEREREREKEGEREKERGYLGEGLLVGDQVKTVHVLNSPHSRNHPQPLYPKHTTCLRSGIKSHVSIAFQVQGFRYHFPIA